MKATPLIGLFFVTFCAGCVTITPDRDKYLELKGVVQDAAGHPQAKIPVRVKTAPSAFQSAFLILALDMLWPVSRELTDEEGRFTCVVPAYTAYHIYAGEAPGTKTGSAYVETKGKKIDHGIIITLR